MRVIGLWAARIWVIGALALVVTGLPGPATAQVTAFKQAVAEAAARDEVLAEFYRTRQFEPIWTGNRDRARRAALMAAFEEAGAHGLPAATYDAEALMTLMRGAETPQERGALEVRLSRLFLDYARDVQTGMLVPSRIDIEMRREVPLRDPLATITAFAQSNPSGFLRALPPSSPEYGRLLRAKLELERRLGQGGFGPTVSRALEPGASGQDVVALRNRLIAMGHLSRSATQTYDATIQAGVQRFQQAMGLEPDGVAGPATIEALNVPLTERLGQIVVAMERERWINRPLGERHIWVNLTDFSAAIVDKGAVTFRTRSVIGATVHERQTPEFSDVMEFMVVNPSWYVPRSIIMREYLPMLRRNPNAVSHLIITDSRGRQINRSATDFTRYTERTFPYAMRQPPSRGNALGLVKFMFPNRYNIYLHDTPAKNLFSRQVRAYSHGCIRLNDPFDFAYELLSPQTADPEGFFHGKLNTGRELRIDLEVPVPVHLVYRTAFTTADGRVHFRNDIYNRDSRIWAALQREGVAIRAVGG